MPKIKNQLRRMCALYSIVRTAPIPISKEKLIDKIQLKTDEIVCNSTIEKDMFTMRMDLDIEIRYNRRRKGYVIRNSNQDTDKLFIHNLFLYLSLQDVPFITELLDSLDS